MSSTGLFRRYMRNFRLWAKPDSLQNLSMKVRATLRLAKLKDSTCFARPKPGLSFVVDPEFRRLFSEYFQGKNVYRFVYYRLVVQ